jgi:hypothetical protein
LPDRDLLYTSERTKSFSRGGHGGNVMDPPPSRLPDGCPGCLKTGPVP